MPRRVCWISLALLALAPLAAAQELSDSAAGRGPRFLLAATLHPVPVDIGRTPVLRQRISLDLGDVPLKEAVTAIAQQSGLELVYSDDVLPPGARVSLRAEGITVAAALTDVLTDADVDVVFSRNGRAALVARAKAGVLDSGSVRGRVTDAKSEQPIVGASVVLVGTRWRATTDENGQYRIADVAPGTYTLTASRIGYAKQTRTVTVGAGPEVSVDVALETAATALEEVVVTGTIVPTQVKALPSPITVITAEDIRAKHVQRIEQLFRGDVPGVIAPDQGTSDDITRVYTRGGSDLGGLGAVKTYVDGVEVRTSSFLSLIDPSSIERIELTRGPQASTIYGSGALDGVLQIFTKKGSATRPIFDGRVAGGAIQTQWLSKDAAPSYLGNASISGGDGSFSYNVGAGRNYKGEWVSEYRNAETNVYGSVAGGRGSVTAELSGRLSWAAYGIPFNPLLQRYSDVPALSKPFQTDGNYQDEALGITVRAKPTPHWQHTVTLGVDRVLQEFAGRAPRFTTPADSFLSLFSSNYSTSTVLYTTTLQGGLSHWLAGSVTAGVNLTSTKGTTVQGTLAPVTEGSGSLATVFFAAHSLGGNRGYFSQAQLGFADALFLTAGLRAENNDAYGQDYGLAWSPRAGVSYVHRLAGVMLKVRGSYGKSIRAPAASARIGGATAGGIILPNPLIGPESQHGVDAGVEVYAGDWGTLQATYYNQTAGDLIDRLLLEPGPPATFQYQNIGQIKNKGLELQGSLDVVRGITLGGTYTIMNSKVQRLSPAYTGALQVGDRLLNIPQHTAGGTLAYSGGGWTASVGALHSGSWINLDYAAYYDYAYHQAPYRGSLRAYWITYPSFTKLRLVVSRHVAGAVTAFVSTDNLTDSYAYETYNLAAPPGRTTTAGLDLRF